MTYDYAADIEAPTAKQLAELANLVTELQAADADLARAEEAVKRAKELRRDVAEVRLPDLMDEVGMKEFETSSGFKIKVRTSTFASIPKTRRDEAMNWLEDHGDGGMIKSTVTVAYGRDEGDAADQLVAVLAEQGVTAKLDEGVHSATLKAWARERMESGKEIDLELFGVFQRREAKID